MSRLTRQEMKRDEVREQFEGFFHYLSSHWKSVAIGFVAFLAIVFGSLGVKSLLAHRSDRAAEMLAEALKVANAPAGVENAQPDDASAPTFATLEARNARAKELFGEIEEGYGSSSSADVARVYLGGIALEEGRQDKARELWSDFVDDRPDHLLTATVRVNLLRLDRSMGKGEEVVAELQEELARTEGRILPEDVVLYELGSTLEELGRPEEARPHYQRLVDEFPQSGYRSEAQRSLGAMPG